MRTRAWVAQSGWASGQEWSGISRSKVTLSAMFRVAQEGFVRGLEYGWLRCSVTSPLRSIYLILSSTKKELIFRRSLQLHYSFAISCSTEMHGS